MELAERYVGWLAGAGTARGLIGPRETPRLWERHVLNCVVLESELPESGSVADVGSGAGLPGLVLAIARPDVQFTLIEPLLRRTTFLDEVVGDLGLSNVQVRRARAEELSELSFDVVTSRAVAPLEKLAAWSLPLVRVGGVFLPMKGESAEAELSGCRPALEALGAGHGEVVHLGTGVVQSPVTVIRLPKVTEPRGRARSGPKQRRGRRSTRGGGGSHERTQ